MISVTKLYTLSPKHRYRKACQVLELMETSLRSLVAPDTLHESRPHAAPMANASLESCALQESTTTLPRDELRWLEDFSRACSADEAVEEKTRALATRLESMLAGMDQDLAIFAVVAGNTPVQQVPAVSPRNARVLELIRAVNTLRRSLEAAFGSAPADWDFFAPLGAFNRPRTYFKGVRVFLEDIRSPFNVGSIFRTADACGFEEVLLSGLSAGPLHPRALRTAMGATDIVPWRSFALEGLASFNAPIIALELGGESIDSFAFPERGIVVLGSEELGISPEARALCTMKVSIPMLGAKGSLNVGVAFGILANAWRAWLMNHGVSPVLDKDISKP